MVVVTVADKDQRRIVRRILQFPRVNVDDVVLVGNSEAGMTQPLDCHTHSRLLSGPFFGG
jgi:hypothetical protein